MRRSAPRCSSQPAISAATLGATKSGRSGDFCRVLDTARYIAPPSCPLPYPPNRPNTMAKRVVDVLVPVALDRAYSYRVPEELTLAPGDIVSVPLGARGETTAVVWADNPKPNPRLDNRLKDVEDKLELPPLKAE